MAEATIPTASIVLLCDHVIIEKETEKKTLIGIFEKIFLKQLPSSYEGYWLYAKLTDALGDYVFKIKRRFMSDLSSRGEISFKINVAASKPSQTEIIFQMPMTPFEQYGEYAFEIYANDVLIGSTILSVIERK